jgi:hypothetical protein
MAYAKRTKGAITRERMAVWEYGQDIAYLSYKAKAAGTLELHWF